jgi:ubiquitin conjugation factor E4 B
MISKIWQKYFMSFKVAEKLANLLNYSLDVFTSKRGLKLKIKNMEDYGFSPKFILSSLISTYASFVDFKEFLELIVKDERSYKYETFMKVLEINERGKIKWNYEDFENFVKIVDRLKEVEIELKSKEVNYDDAPEEFLDQITTLLMDDPVLLPSSKQIVDRNSIVTHLMSDPKDPFDRSPLTLEMLIPATELRERIEQYKKSKIQK